MRNITTEKGGLNVSGKQGTDTITSNTMSCMWK